jgi:hypothetical protein
MPRTMPCQERKIQPLSRRLYTCSVNSLSSGRSLEVEVGVEVEALVILERQYRRLTSAEWALERVEWCCLVVVVLAELVVLGAVVVLLGAVVVLAVVGPQHCLFPAERFLETVPCFGMKMCPNSLRWNHWLVRRWMVLLLLLLPLRPMHLRL